MAFVSKAQRLNTIQLALIQMLNSGADYVAYENFNGNQGVTSRASITEAIREITLAINGENNYEPTRLPEFPQNVIINALVKIVNQNINALPESRRQTDAQLARFQPGYAAGPGGRKRTRMQNKQNKSRRKSRR